MLASMASPLRAFVTFLVLGSLLAACARPEPARPAPEGAAHGTAPVAVSGQEAVRFRAQPGWIEESPSSGMRKAQFRLPGAAGEATLVVYHFGAGGGGGVEANLERWAGQFEQPDGASSRARLKTESRKLGSHAVTEAELEGTYVAETSPGSGVHVREERWGLVASIVEAPEGAYYVKLVGPTATVGQWRASYRAFLEESWG